MNGSGLERKKKKKGRCVRTWSCRWALPRVVSLKKKEKSHNITPGASEKKKKKSHITPEAPIVLPPKTQHIRCLQMPPPLLAPEPTAERLHRKIQIVSRAVRLLEHKLRGEALLSVSNILSIIHKEERGIKRCWLELKKRHLTAELTQQLHMAWCWFLLSAAFVRTFVSEAASTVSLQW